jgi:hypothetical protein
MRGIVVVIETKFPSLGNGKMQKPNLNFRKITCFGCTKRSTETCYVLTQKKGGKIMLPAKLRNSLFDKISGHHEEIFSSVNLNGGEWSHQRSLAAVTKRFFY